MSPEPDGEQRDSVARIPIYCEECSDVYAGWRLDSERVFISMASYRCGNSKFTVLGG